MEATQQAPSAPQVNTAPAQEPHKDHAPEKPPVQQSKDQEKILSSLLDKAVDETIRRRAQDMALETAQIEQDGRIAVMMYNAGLYNDLKDCSPSQATARALVKIELGRTMGIGPFEAMNVIYFVNGRPSLDSGIRAARMKRAGYDWKVVQQDDKGCILLLLKDGRYITRPVLKDGVIQFDDKGNVKEEPVVISFLEADAQRAGLLTKSGSLYKTYPKIMYFNRAISGAQKTYAPEVLNGSDMVSREEAEEIEPMPPGATMPGTIEAARDVLKGKLAQFNQAREDAPTEPGEAVVQETGKGPAPEEVKNDVPKSEPRSESGKGGILFGEGLDVRKTKK